MDKKEKKFLENTLKMLNDEAFEKRALQRSFLNYFGLSAMFFVIVFGFSSNFNIDNVISYGLIFVSGGLFFLSLSRVKSNKYWPTIKRYIDKNRIESELENEET